ncbi:hypothetical protein [Corynebacterium sp. 335C]
MGDVTDMAGPRGRADAIAAADAKGAVRVPGAATRTATGTAGEVQERSTPATKTATAPAPDAPPPGAAPPHRDVVVDADVRVLLRPGPAVQFGADPDRALVFRLPPGSRPGAVLRALLASARTASPGLHRDLAAAGVPADLAGNLLDELVRAGLASRGGRRPAHPVVTVIGRDLLRRRLVADLRERGVAAAGRAPGPRTMAWLDAASPAEAGAVAVTGMEIPDPALLALLRRRGLPHLCARVRDGAAVVGPWWAPGDGGGPSPGPCPACGEAEAAAADPARRVLALQLASPQAAQDAAAVAAASAIACAQLVRGPSAAVLAAETTVDPHRLVVRRRDLAARRDCPVCRGGAAAGVAQSAP